MALRIKCLCRYSDSGESFPGIFSKAGRVSFSFALAGGSTVLGFISLEMPTAL